MQSKTEIQSAYLLTVVYVDYVTLIWACDEKALTTTLPVSNRPYSAMLKGAESEDTVFAT